MVKQNKQKVVNSWSELIEIVSNLNHYNETIILNGWVREILDGKEYIRKLYFTVAPNKILKELNQSNAKPKRKRK